MYCKYIAIFCSERGWGCFSPFLELEVVGTRSIGTLILDYERGI